MRSSFPTDFAPPFAPTALPTRAPKLTALAGSSFATTDSAGLRQQLPELQLPLFGYRLDWGVRCRGESG